MQIKTTHTKQNHFHTGCYNRADSAVEVGLLKLITLAMGGGYTDAKIWLPNKNMVETHLKSHLSTVALKRFLKGSFQVGTITVHLVTPRLPVSRRGPILAIFPDAMQLPILAVDSFTTDLIFLPYMEEWLAAYLLEYPDSSSVELFVK